MGIFLVPKSPKGPSRLESVGVATLGGVQVSLTLLEKLMDGTSIPFVKGAVGAALEVIKIAKAIQADSDDCESLIKRTTCLMIVILDSLKEKTEEEIPDYLKQAIGRLTTTFNDVLNELKVIDKRIGKRSSSSIARAILYHFDNTEKLKECSAKLEWAINEFQVTSKVDSCLKDLERHEELRSAQKEIQAEQNDLRLEVTDGQAKIQEELHEIKKAVKEKISGTASLSLPSTFMPASPRIFGRQSYVNKAIQLILSSTSTRIVILGPGGMGKTSVALKTIHDSRIIERFGINRRWVPCEQATSVPLFIELIAKSLNIPPSSSNDRFSEIIAALEESNILVIVLFDNFETIWDLEGEQSAIANILARLASIPSVSFILTMRGIQHPASQFIDWTSPRLPPLTPLEMDPAQEAFVKISPDSEGDPKLPELLRELDCVPLAITLMARLAEVGESITELLSQWRQEQVRLLSQPGGDRTSSIEVSIRLSLTSLPVRMNADAIPLLSILARLPGGASLERLPTICPSITGWKGALRVLRTAALVYDSPDKAVIHMLSPIRSYIMLHHPLGEGPLRDLRNAYFQLACKGDIYYGDPHLDEALAELSKEDINLETIILDALHIAEDKEDAINAATWYSQFLNLTQPRANVIEAAVQVARHTDSLLLADCLECYGESLRYQSHSTAASIALEEARDRYVQLNDKLSVARCLWSLGDISFSQSQYDDARSRLEEAGSLFAELNKPEGFADCISILGTIYEFRGQFEIAVSTLERAKSQFIELGSELGRAKCLSSLGRVYRAQGQYRAASSAAEEAKLAYTNSRSQRGLARTLLLLSHIHYDQDQYSDAFSAAEEARRRYIGMGDTFGISSCLLSMGSALLKQGRYDEAHRYAEEAENGGLRMGNSLGLANSRRLLGDIYRMEGEHDRACSLLEDAKSLLIQQNKNVYVSLDLADCNSSLGKLCRLRGKYDNAIKLLDEARTTYSTLGRGKKDADECTEEITLALKARDNREQAD